MKIRDLYIVERHNLSDNFKQWFAGSRVVDDTGKPLIVYHGTGADISVFNTNGRGKTDGSGAFFSDDPKIAQTYGNAIYPAYLRMTNPLIVDLNGRGWNNISYDDAVIEYDDGTQDMLFDVFGFDYDDQASTDDIARNAKLRGYDGVIMNYVKDRGPRSDSDLSIISTVYVVFKPEQIKSIYNNGQFSSSSHISERLMDWSNKWIHYSRIPQISINPKARHMDPLGIYLFPSNFTPVSYWAEFPYKFVVDISPNANILDFSTVSEQQMEDFLETAGCLEKYKSLLGMYPENDLFKRYDMMWSQLTEHYMLGKRQAAFNKLFRNYGYDAIFDDKKIIHTSEVQLLVLNPSIIKVVDMQRYGGSGYADMKKILSDLETVCSEYGDVEIIQPHRKHQYGKSVLYSSIKIISDEKYARISMYTDEKLIIGSLNTTPSLNYGCGFRFSLALKTFDRDSYERMLKTIQQFFKSTK